MTEGGPLGVTAFYFLRSSGEMQGAMMCSHFISLGVETCNRLGKGKKHENRVT